MPGRLNAASLLSRAISLLISKSGRGLQAEHASPLREGGSLPRLHSADGSLALNNHSAKPSMTCCGLFCFTVHRLLVVSQAIPAGGLSLPAPPTASKIP